MSKITHILANYKFANARFGFPVANVSSLFEKNRSDFVKGKTPSFYEKSLSGCEYASVSFEFMEKSF